MFCEPLSLSAILCLILLIGSDLWFLFPVNIWIGAGVGATFFSCLGAAVGVGCEGVWVGWEGVGVAVGCGAFSASAFFSGWAGAACFEGAALASVSYSTKSAPTSILSFSLAKSFLITPDASDLISTFINLIWD